MNAIDATHQIRRALMALYRLAVDGLSPHVDAAGEGCALFWTLVHGIGLLVSLPERLPADHALFLALAKRAEPSPGKGQRAPLAMVVRALAMNAAPTPITPVVDAGRKLGISDGALSLALSLAPDGAASLAVLDCARAVDALTRPTLARDAPRA